MIEIRFTDVAARSSDRRRDTSKAAFEDGKYCQAFPFSVLKERRTSNGFSRIHDKPIRRRYQVYNPDYVVVLDETLQAVDIISGLKEGAK